MKTLFPFLSVLTVLTCLTTGCDFWKNLAGRKADAPVQTTEALPVGTMNPIERQVTDYEEFTGQTRAIDKVNIQAQVSGILSKRLFTEGTEVKKDDVLFEIEPEVYQAVLDNAQAQLGILEARLPRLESDLKRATNLKDQKVVTEDDYEKALADRNVCLAEIAAAKAAIDQARINVKYTKVTSPIDGYIGRELVTEGNLIQANATPLVEMVSLDPIYVYFYVDENTVLRLQSQLQNQLKESSREDTTKSHTVGMKIEFRLSNEKEFKYTGVVEYADPFMNQTSGTRLLRATCENKKQASGTRAFLPGMMVHVRVPVEENYSALLVPEEALASDQGTRFIYVVDKAGKAQMRHLELGPIQDDNLRVVRKGLQKTDRIIVDGLLKVRPEMPVKETPITLDKLREGI